MSKASLVRLSDVSYCLQDRMILRGVSWEVLRGERWAILGANGSGKSTLLRLAAGYVRPNAGGEICWRDERRIDLRDLRLGIGWVSDSISADVPIDEPVLDTVVSGRFAQVGLVPYPGYEPNESDYEDARSKLSVLGFQHLASERFGYLSQGEKQLVLIARACMAQPWWIVLDEPCAGLDPGARERFLDSLQRFLLAEPKLSVAFVTHHLEEILPEFESLLVVKEGQIVASGKKRQILTNRLLADLYQVAVEELAERNGRYWPVFAPSSRP
ncbi:MAG: ATP-binding cassette domain-containing protein [Planctomycetota bacterium]|nr:ATP-binding cassette domain-containing protein [Planctomycetota bacterium]MDA1177975.1 ATP-binding cassette domain-containing protein [Planctomycetota bacterium]